MGKYIKQTFLFSLIIFICLSCSTENKEYKFDDAYILPKQKLGKVYASLKQSNLTGELSLIENTLQESIVGLTSLSVNEGESDFMVWMDRETEIYNRIKSSLQMDYIGEFTTDSILILPQIKDVVKGYILYDKDNQESLHAGTIASHIYKGILVEKSIEHRLQTLNYKKLFDATNMTLSDAWNRFKDKCNNNILILMPTLTSNLRSLAISNRCMIVNLNRKMGTSENGTNKDLLCEILNWLAPLSPVFGWEQGVSGEDAFVGLVSQYGNIMIPCDWIINAPIMCSNYENECSKLKIKNISPNEINYGDANHYMSFYMSDGDNVQWMFNGFDNDYYYKNPYITKTKMSFGFPICNLSMISPKHFSYLINDQNPSSSLVESLGGGYYYVDTFSDKRDREKNMEKVAKMVGTRMNEHNCKVLGLVAMDAVSEKSQKAYSTFIDNNDELIGIVVIQYSPYAGGNGDIFWFQNKKGVHIPVITVRYSIWNYGVNNNGYNEGTPAYIANKYNNLPQNEKKFSVTSVHAWSNFTKCNDLENFTSENTPNGNIRGVFSAQECMRKLNNNTKIVNIEELIWQLRMEYYPEETKQIIQKLY